MAYSESKKMTTLERQIQALKLQLYGKDQSLSKPQFATTFFKTPLESQNPTLTSTPIYLCQDLVKIALLASAAILIQVLIYFSLNRGLLKFFTSF